MATPHDNSHTGDALTVAVIGREGLSDHVRAVNNRVRVYRKRWWGEGDTIDAKAVVADLVAEGVIAVCIGHDVPMSDALAVAELVDRDHVEIGVILVASPSPERWPEVLRCGIRDVVDPGSILTDIGPALQRALDRGSQVRHKVSVAVERRTTGRVIMVLSPKGGSGKTTVSSNLAVALAGIADESVVLVDLDVQFGDSASALGIVPEHTVADLAGDGPLDATALKVYLSAHHRSGIYVLCGAESPEEADALTPVRAAEIVDALTEDFGIVVVDTAAGVDDRMLAVLDHATDVVLVANMDVSSIRNLGKEVAALDRAGLLPPSRYFVLNRADEELGLTVTDVEAALGMSVDIAVPSTRDVPLSMNQGRPIVLEEPDSPVARQLRGLARHLAGVDDTDDESRSWFGRKRRAQ